MSDTVELHHALTRLFTFFVDCIVDAIAASGPDGWLGNFHTLMQMDDTAIVATSHMKLVDKLRCLTQCSDNFGQSMHPVKSKFFSVNCHDKNPIVLDNVTVSYTEIYIYLGTPMSNAPLHKQVQNHISNKHNHCMKFTSFLYKNSDAPYHVKESVWQSVLTSALFYSYEICPCKDLHAVNVRYKSTLKQLLGVRATTCNDLVVLEAGLPIARSHIRNTKRTISCQVIQMPRI